jgi:Bifunctional DNA primase/polymerase, N-terminal
MTTKPERTNPRLAAALRYAQAGWAVFPCIPGEKAPATRHGFLDAATDPDKITWWWSRHPEQNVAIATGLPGPDVLDVDVRETGSGFPAFNRLRRAGLLDGASAYVRTPSGGLHAYFTGSEQGNGRLPAHHLDFRSRGGYILAPPSRVGGRPY